MINFVNPDELPVDLKVLSIQGSYGNVVIDIGDTYRYIRIGDLLWNPRTHDCFRVLETPEDRNVKVIGEWGDFDNIFPSIIANFYGVSVKTVIRWCRDGHIPAHKVRGHWVVDKVMICDGIQETIVADTLEIFGMSRET